MSARLGFDLVMRSLICLTLLCAFSTAPCAELTRKDVEFVAHWQGRHKGSGKIGMCTATLIAPRWAITARHCAVKLLGSKPKEVKVRLIFHPHGKKAVKVGVIKACGAELKKKGQAIDIALVKLKSEIRSIQPALLDAVNYKQRMRTKIVPVGTTGGLHWTKAKVASGAAGGKLTVDNTGGSGMKGGDSGGAWLSTNSGSYVLSGVIHGGARHGKKRVGIAYQPSYVREWIDNVTNGKATWTAPPASQKFMETASVMGPKRKNTGFWIWACTLGMAPLSLFTVVRLRRYFKADGAKSLLLSSEEHFDTQENEDGARVE